MTRVLLVSLGLLVTSGAAAQRCPPPPGGPHGDPWPTEVEVPSVVVGEATLRLTRAEGEAIRCALQRRMSRPIPQVPRDLRGQVRDRRVGALWMDGDHPRIGSFFLQRDPDGKLELNDTLHVSAAVRITFVARFEQRRGRWRLDGIGIRTDHHR